VKENLFREGFEYVVKPAVMIPRVRRICIYDGNALQGVEDVAVVTSDHPCPEVRGN